jgi:hypothetical protein
VLVVVIASIDVNHQKYRHKAYAADCVPSLLLIDDFLRINYVVRVVPYSQRLLKRDAVLGEVHARLLRVPIKLGHGF